MPEPPDSSTHDHATKLGRFIQTYSGFLSSFVIGVAGLIATSIWQYRQSQIAVEQAHSEQAAARAKAESDWRIARAEILAKNLNVLSAQGANTADQRFGVLLSLTRGAIIDPELAVSYALELGRDNVNYMRSVLASTSNKNYAQLSEAFKLTCLQRFGVQRAADICKDDKLADRSDAISQLFEDEMEATQALSEPPPGTPQKPAATAMPLAGPMTLLREERAVQALPAKMSWLFEPYLQDLYERRQWKEITRFESASVGARLVGALVLATARTGELTSGTEDALIEKFHADHRKWLVSYLLGPTCDPDCRGRLVDVMLSSYGEAQGDYDEALKRLVMQPRGEAAPTLAHLHARLLWCQVDADDLAEFRDRVLVPAVAQALAQPKADPTTVEDLVRLAALVPDPIEPKALAAWRALLAQMAATSPPPPGKHGEAQDRNDKNDKNEPAAERYQTVFAARRASARRERANPPPMIKKVSFCNAAESAAEAPTLEQ